jgi:hypothetical protein
MVRYIPGCFTAGTHWAEAEWVREPVITLWGRRKSAAPAESRNTLPQSPSPIKSRSCSHSERSGWQGTSNWSWPWCSTSFRSHCQRIVALFHTVCDSDVRRRVNTPTDWHGDNTCQGPGLHLFTSLLISVFVWRLFSSFRSSSHYQATNELEVAAAYPNVTSRLLPGHTDI